MIHLKEKGSFLLKCLCVDGAMDIFSLVEQMKYFLSFSLIFILRFDVFVFVLMMVFVE
jgi:hypothetical protein